MRQARRPVSAGLLGRGATVTTRYERMKMQRRMQQRIRMVVEERRTALALPRAPVERAVDPEATMEIPQRAIGRVTIRPA
jgi:hypothetical protein